MMREATSSLHPQFCMTVNLRKNHDRMEKVALEQEKEDREEGGGGKGDKNNIRTTLPCLCD